MEVKRPPYPVLFLCLAWPSCQALSSAIGSAYVQSIKSHPKRAWFIGLSSLAVIVALIAATFALLPSTQAASITYKAHPVFVSPQLTPAGTPTNHIFGCQTDRGPNAIVCYSPQQIRTAYNINSVLNEGTTGAGHTI